MQLKFITLTLSAVLAISALSANALPTSNPDPTGKEVATQYGSNDVNHGAQAADPAQKDTGALGSLGGLNNLEKVTGNLGTVDKLLNGVTDGLLKDVLKLVKDLLTGDCNNPGVVEKLLQIITGLVEDDKPGKNTGAKNGDIQEPGAPASKNNKDDDDVVGAILNLVKGLLGGKSAEECGGANVVELLEDLLEQLSSNENDSGAKCNYNTGTRGADDNERDERQ